MESQEPFASLTFSGREQSQHEPDIHNFLTNSHDRGARVPGHTWATGETRSTLQQRQLIGVNYIHLG
jgi:hypothetical protein